MQQKTLIFHGTKTELPGYFSDNEYYRLPKPEGAVLICILLLNRLKKEITFLNIW